MVQALGGKLESMDVELMAKSPCGRLVAINGTDPRSGETWRHHAYIPDPLPAEPPLNMAAHSAATRAAMAAARLDQALIQLPNPSLLVRPAIRREAVSTSALEGTYATYDEAFQTDYMADKQLSSDQREVRNYIRATELAIELLKRRPISRMVLGEVQHTIVQGTRDDSIDAGDLRKHQVCIGPEGRPVTEARFVPSPPGPPLEEGFSDWEKWINADNDVPIIAKLALGHYQFETLHPYNNGNGRLGRLVAILQLVEAGVLSAPVMNLSPYLEAHRDEYRDHLLNISQYGTFSEWVIFFSEAVEHEAKEGIQIIDRILQFRETATAELKASNIRGAALDLVDIIVAYPLIDVPTASQQLGKTFETANQAISKLVDRGLLREITGRTMNRVFACETVLRLTSVHRPRG